MKSALVIISALGVALAQFPGVPKCVVDCLVPVIPSTGCAKTDIPCLCAHQQDLAGSITPCVTKACTADELKTAAAVMSKKCH